MSRPLPDIAHGAGFVEVGDRCWVARFAFLDVNVGVVGGERGLLVVDTLAGEPLAREAVGQLRRLGAGEVVAVVNTHQHFDHSFGNAVFAEEYGAPPLFAHENAAAELPAHAGRARDEAARVAADPDHPDRERAAEVAAARLLVPDRTFSSAKAVDLGDRLVELVHPGRGHTAGDVVVRVGDADVVFAGDLVEESTVDHQAPGFGEDSFPLEWPASLDLVVGLLNAGTVVVPGHGLPVDRDFVSEQRTAVGMVAQTIGDLAGRGVPVEQALAAGEWPYPRESLVHAVRRGYAQLPRGGRRLPMA